MIILEFCLCDMDFFRLLWDVSKKLFFFYCEDGLGEVISSFVII